MNNQEVIAKAMEIAISLTGASHEWLHTDDRGFVFIKEPLFTTWKTVIRALSSIVVTSFVLKESNAANAVLF
jgi:hypothetical protein